MSALDSSYTRAIALIDEVEPRLANVLTEEDAKLQLIARFLTEILGWDHADISAERKNDAGYSDYIVSDAGRPAMLVEAKRQGQLELSTSATAKQTYKISGPALKQCLGGIEQAASYCAPEGIQFALVTDGCTWIFFKPFVPGESYKSKEAIVFPTLRSVEDDFASFFELASKEGHQRGSYKHVFDKLHDKRLLLTQGLHSAFSDGDMDSSTYRVCAKMPSFTFRYCRNRIERRSPWGKNFGPNSTRTSKAEVSRFGEWLISFGTMQNR